MPQAEILTLTCPSCGARLNIPDASNRFTCGYCGNEHIIQIQVQPVAPVAKVVVPPVVVPPQVAPAIRPHIDTPASVQVIRDNQSARIVQRWFSAKYIPMAFFAFFWDAFLVFWYTVTISGHAPFIFIIFPMVHVAIGIGITYSTIAGFLNRTTLELDRDELSVWFEPVPWWGEKRIKTRDIKQLYCKEEVQRTKSGSSLSYDLYAVTQDIKQVKLLSGVESPDVALFFEQELEAWLHITDQPVRGEVAK